MEKQLILEQKKLIRMDKMKYVVDRIENNIIILENLKDKSILEIPKDKINFLIKDGDVLYYDNNKFRLDLETKKKRIELIKEKFNKVKKKKGLLRN